MVKLRPYVVAVNHVPECPRQVAGQDGRSQGHRRCAPGLSQKQIATLIGPRNTASTERYTHLRAGDTVDLAAGLEVALQRAGESA